MDGTRWSRAQASIIGVALILGVTIAVAIAVVALGSSALTDTEERSQVQQAEQALTQFDSVASQVALGQSDTQQLDLGPQAGDYTVREGAGTMKIIHVNFDGTTCDDGDTGIVGDPDTSDSCGDDDHVIHQQDLGAIEYQKGDTTLAYQGGGVWRLGSGEARMVSPPEFHYRAATLTFPVVTVTGDGSGAGGTTASISAKQKGVDRYPCRAGGCGYPDTDGDSDGFPASADSDDDGGPYTNPVQNGYVKVQVTSKYAAAWEQYFRTRTEGQVSRSGDTVEVRLISLGGVGDFAMPPEGTPLPIRGVSQSSEHPMQEFTVTIGDEDKSNRDLNNAYWSFYAGDTDGEMLEFHVQTEGKCKSGDFEDGGSDGTARLAMFYRNDETGAHEEWVSEPLNPDTSSALDVDCSGEATLTVDWMDAGTDLYYEEIDKTINVGGSGNGNNRNNKFVFDSQVKSYENSDPSDTLDDHSSEDHGNVAADSDSNLETGDDAAESLEYLTGHYVGTMPSDFEFRMNSGPANSNPIDYKDSFGTFKYDLATNPKYVTYLHVSENEVKVAFD